MRIEIARAAKESDGPVAVVCGAWHVPALAVRHSPASDRELLRGRPKAKTKATWAPWTTPRIARASGYGAGVVAPGWCAHLWQTGDAADRASVWLARVARVMRARGHVVSTAAAIEAQRLGTALAAMRGRPAPGFEELREADRPSVPRRARGVGRYRRRTADRIGSGQHPRPTLRSRRCARVSSASRRRRD